MVVMVVVVVCVCAGRCHFGASTVTTKGFVARHVAAGDLYNYEAFFGEDFI